MREHRTATRFRRTAIAVGFGLLIAACGLALADSPDPDPNATTIAPQPPTSSTSPSTTAVPPPPTSVVPGVVSVPDLAGSSLADAQQLLSELGLVLVAMPSDIDSAVVVAQEPAPGVEVDEGTVVTVDVRVILMCNPPDPIAPGAGQVILSVLVECGNESVVPSSGIGVPRIVPEQNGDAIDRIEWTLRSLLAGLTDDERAVGFVSAFDAATADALNSVTLIDGRVVVDFNDAIIVNNMSTSTGMIQFHADLHRNVFQYHEVDTVEFQFNGDCEAWSALFESDGCHVVSRADWDQDLIEWDELRNQ